MGINGWETMQEVDRLGENLSVSTGIGLGRKEC